MSEHTTFVDDPAVDTDEEDADDVQDASPAKDDHDEVASGELVERDDGNDQTSAIERAAEAAIANPGIPGRDEFLTLAAQARMLSLSDAAPKEVRDNPHVAFHVAMVGRDFGISPSAALELVDVINTRSGIQISLSPQLLNGQIRRMGLGSIVPAVREADRSVAVAVGPNGRVDPRCRTTWPEHWRDTEDPTGRCGCRDIIGDFEFTWEDAQTAGLAQPGCRPGDHTDECTRWVRHRFCNTGYKNYPKRMMWWRASGYCADDFFPEASLGLYSPEELGAVVDENGRPLDPAEVSLPPGYEPGELAAGSQQDNTGNEPASQETKDALAARIAEIKKSGQAAQALRNIWTAEMDDGNPRLPPLKKLRNRDVEMAETAVASVEAQIQHGKFDDFPAAESDDEQTDTPAADAGDDTDDEAGEGSGDELVDEVVAEVKAMPLADVIDALGHRDLTVRGNEQAKRQRLAQALYEDRIGAPVAAGDESTPGQEDDEGEDGPGPENATQGEDGEAGDG